MTYEKYLTICDFMPPLPGRFLVQATAFIEADTDFWRANNLDDSCSTEDSHEKAPSEIVTVNEE